MTSPSSQYNLPPASGYHSYGAAVPQDWSPHNHKSATFLEEQGEVVDFTKPAKMKDGFIGFSGIDMLGMLVTFLLPLLIFAGVYALVGYYFHYKYSTLAWGLVLVFLAIVAFMGYVAVSRMLQEADGVSDHLAVWAAAIFLGVNLAFFAALIFGLRNYGHNMEPYYERMELNTYTDIDPSSMDGKAFMDAGTMKFKAGSHLDLTKSTGFMNLNMYCVAPIVSSGKDAASYDFWAVGMNCCTGAPQSFACGDMPSLTTDSTSGGLRLMSGSELPFYKLAVTQAASNYGITSAHPIFFYWVQDPDAALSELRKTGWSSFLPALSFFAIFQAFLVIGAATVVVMVKSKYKGKMANLRQ